MAISLDELIVESRDLLVDRIVKDAIGQIPSYSQAPLQVTIERVEQWLDKLAESVEQNDPDILEDYLVSVAGERRREGYAIMELHGIVHITERHLQHLIRTSGADEIEQNALMALLDAVTDAARMVLSVRYLLSLENRSN
jgi:hypothetical protein